MRRILIANRAFSLYAVIAGFAAAIAGPPAVRPADDAAADNDSQLTEIVVTRAAAHGKSAERADLGAGHRQITQLADHNLNSLVDLSQTCRALHVSAGAASSDMYIRGIGSGDQQSFDQSVGTFVDDIYHGRARSSTDMFFDIDRIEVLKGPQSTFFGNNAIAGALNIVTNKPTDTFDASARALYGIYGQYAFESAPSAGPSTTCSRSASRASSTAAKAGSRTSTTG